MMNTAKKTVTNNDRANKELLHSLIKKYGEVDYHIPCKMYRIRLYNGSVVFAGESRYSLMKTLEDTELFMKYLECF